MLTNHARVLLWIEHDPAARLRDLAASLSITERTAHGILTDLAEAGYVIKRKDGRRNRYQVQSHMPMPGPGTREPAIGEVLALFTGPYGSPSSSESAAQWGNRKLHPGTRQCTGISGN